MQLAHVLRMQGTNPTGTEYLYAFLFGMAHVTAGILITDKLKTGPGPKSAISAGKQQTTCMLPGV